MSDPSADSAAPPRLGIVGGGRSAWAFAHAWQRIGWPLAGVSLRPGSTSPLPHLLGIASLAPEDLIRTSDVVLLATPDHAISDAASIFDCDADVLLFHSSGSMDSSILPRRERAFSLHPLRALPPPGEPDTFQGTLFVFEGSARGRLLAASFVGAAGGTFLEIEARSKPLYHAAAVFGSNYLALLMEQTSDLFRDIGLEGRVVDEAISALATSAIKNWLRQEGTARFTGPIARADTQLVRTHLDALKDDPAALQLYRILGRHLLSRVHQIERDSPRMAALRGLLESD